MNELLEGYIEDLKDNLICFNRALMDIQSGNTDAEVINNIFRVAHTIKGNSAAVEFERIEKVMHTMEDILHEVRSGARQFSNSILEVLYACHDFLEDCLDVVEKNSSDSSVDISKMLSLFLSVGKDKAIESKETLQPPHVETNIVNDMSGVCGMPVDFETWKVIAENSKRGFCPYSIEVDFDESCVMKSIRAWFVFEAVENLAILIYSNPARPDEEAFRDGRFSFEETTMQFVVLTEKDIDELIESIQKCDDIISVRKYCISQEEINTILQNYEMKGNVLNKIKEISILLVDTENTTSGDDLISNIIELMEAVCNLNLTANQSYIKPIASEIAEILSEKVISGQNLDIKFTEILTQVLQLMEYDFKITMDINNQGHQQAFTRFVNELKILSSDSPQRIGDILKVKGILKEEDVHEILKEQSNQTRKLKFGQIAVKENKTSAYEVIKALEDQQTNQEKKGISTPKQESAFIRVPVTKVDSLMDMLSELLIFNSQLERQVEEVSVGQTEMINTLSREAKLIKGIQSLSMSLRMIEIKPTLHRLTRIARDTASELNKKVTVVLEGEDTEMDRSAAEKIFDPLMHLVRNSVSHGIEQEVERVALGKNPEGKVTIRAYNKRGSVYIEVSDDGKGMDTAAILHKAQTLKMVEESKEYSEDEIIRFIFKPGFSTQEQINSISGRGVGMNVVEDVINHMGGKIDIVNALGKGCTFILRIPLNLAVVNGTIVEVSGGRYIIPTSFIKEFYITEDSNWISMQGKRKVVHIRDCVIPVINSCQIFSKDDDFYTDHKNELVILELEQKLLAFPVDKILSRQEIVSKPLDSEFSGIGYASGASILGDGVISLILDIESIFRLSSL